MMADDQALQGQPSHLANGSRGRSQLLPNQPHGFTGYEPNRPASMPSTPRRLGEAPGPPRVNPDVRAGMPAAGSGTQAPAQVWRMLREVVHLHRGDEEASRERFVYEQQEGLQCCCSKGASTHRVGRDRRISSSRTQPAGRATPQPLLNTRANLFQLPFEECGVTSTGRGGQHPVSPPAIISCKDFRG